MRYLTPILLLLLALAVPGAEEAAEVAEAAPAEAAGWLGQIFSVYMLPLWLCSIGLVALIFERIRGLRQGAIISSDLVDGVVERMARGEVDEARRFAEADETVVGKAWGQALHEFQLGGAELREVLTNTTLLAFKPLKRNLQAITTLGVISPLMGLLGTVIGMIITFDQIAATGGADKAALAGGIAVAMFTTAAGLIVAIPAIVAGRFFKAKLTGFAERAEEGILRIGYRFTNFRAELRKAEAAPLVEAAAAPLADGETALGRAGVTL
ncbi:MAG: MotA/TolQ/ExbB proton channel family protein [Planctomycetota bacterium]|jgi:biopolymer transport protein ExbB|nr:MotA/TolQ/ExbB proton channel family protein [Planctomycetota bacterium]